MTGPLVTGLELVAVRGLADAAGQDRSKFPAAAFTAAEWRLFHDRPQSLAGRLAAKAAAAKALGMDLAEGTSDGVAATEIETLPLASGQPRLQLSGRAAARAATLGLSRWFVSISHTRELAVALVVGCGDAAATTVPPSGEPA